MSKCPSCGHKLFDSVKFTAAVKDHDYGENVKVLSCTPARTKDGGAWIVVFEKKKVLCTETVQLPSDVQVFSELAVAHVVTGIRYYALRR